MSSKATTKEEGFHEAIAPQPPPRSVLMLTTAKGSPGLGLAGRGICSAIQGAPRRDSGRRQRRWTFLPGPGSAAGAIYSARQGASRRDSGRRRPWTFLPGPGLAAGAIYSARRGSPRRNSLRPRPRDVAVPAGPRTSCASRGGLRRNVRQHYGVKSRGAGGPLRGPQSRWRLLVKLEKAGGMGNLRLSGGDGRRRRGAP